MHDSHTQEHCPCSLCFDLGKLQPIVPCAARKLSKMIMIPPKLAATKDPNYDRCQVTNNGSMDQTACILQALIPM